ncbi:MAG: class I SAM-dependent methyltransferase [Pseudomonadota bacterium]
MTATYAPVPSPRFWDRIAARYARQPVADETAYRRKLEVTQSYFQPDWQVLELGCGTGSTALAHAPHVAHILATDLSTRMLEIGRSKAALAGVRNVTFRQAAVEDFDAPPESFDAVLGLSLLHLLADERAALAKIRGLLKPGGIFVSSTVCMKDMTGVFFRLILPVGRALRVFPMVRSFSADTLRSNLRAAGFEIDHDWRPAPGKALFLVARKPA